MVRRQGIKNSVCLWALLRIVLPEITHKDIRVQADHAASPSATTFASLFVAANPILQPVCK
jgi:hypothetical protein